jgi:catalase
VTVPERLQAREDHDKVRGKPEKFADHYTQAALFYNSQTPVEQAHIVAGFRFELSKVAVVAIRQRMVASLRNVCEPLARNVADGLGMRDLPEPLPRALPRPPTPEVAISTALSLTARPGDGSILASRVAILVADGVHGTSVQAIHAALLARGAVPRFVAPCIGAVRTTDGVSVDAQASLENEPGFLFDALVLPDGASGVTLLSKDVHTMDFIRDQYRHGKTILVLEASAVLLDKAGVSPLLASGKADPGVVMAQGADTGVAAFVEGVAKHRHPERELVSQPV